MITSPRTISWCYFFIHALVEIVCFALLHNILGPGLSFIVAFTYDFFAFVPQALFGELNHRLRKLDLGSLGVALMLFSIFLLNTTVTASYLAGILLLGLGNSMLHEAGAIATVTISEGKLFPSSLFVGGGSFGLIIGQTLGKLGINNYVLVIPLIIIEILVLLTNSVWLTPRRQTPSFHITKKETNAWFIIFVAFMVTTVRSYIGYAIPISWNKTLWQSFFLFFTMGLGKTMGGYLSDRLGARRVGICSTLFCIPFLILGKDFMLISIIGVFLFSMTMPICFGMLLSTIKDNPGLAFGITTLGLFLGICPMLFFGSFGYLTDSILVITLSLLSALGLYKTLQEKEISHD